MFPEMVKLLDSQLTVRLVSFAGSLEKLARFPSSTIQLLGAERALFRHMSDGSLPEQITDCDAPRVYAANNIKVMN